MDSQARIICQFSCGAASAVATKLILAQYGGTHDVQVINAFVAEEHPDNRRFLLECETWFGRSITVLRDEKYGASALEVFRRERYIKGRSGAPCSRALKRRLLDRFKRSGDVAVFGFTVEEMDRWIDFQEHYEGRALAPLIERGLGKDDCKAIIERAGMTLPLMYRLGYSNANCIGCPKGGMGYWRAIRADFPEQFEAFARVQEDIGPGAYMHYDRKTGVRFSVRDLPAGLPQRNEEIPNCSFFCAAAERELEQSA